MVKPDDILDAVVGEYKKCENVLSELGDDEGAIVAYYGDRIGQQNVAAAIYKMPHPGVLVTYHGFSPQDRGLRMGHAIRLYVRGSNKLLYYLVNDTASSGFPVESHEFTSELGSMNPPTAMRGQFAVGQEATDVIDYWILDFTLAEKG